MKRLVLLLLIPFNIVFAQPKDYKAEARLVYEHLRNREFDKAASFMQYTGGKVMDSAVLRRTWDNLIRLTGPAIKILDVTEEAHDTIHYVFVLCQFELYKMKLRMSYGPNQKISKMTILPGEKKEVYKSPDYYKPENIKEKTLNIENGPLRLSGILAVPKEPGRYPVVILVHGSGPNDKDESIGPMKIFKDFAIGLASRGIAVYRYTKRSRVYPVMANDKAITPTEETVEDVISAINTVKADSSVDSTAIYLCGHGFGGMMLPRIAAQVSDIKGLIYLAANGRPLEDIFYEQAQYYQLIDTTGTYTKATLDSVKSESDKVKTLKKTDPDSIFIFKMPKGYWLYLKNYDFIKTAQSLKCPMLFIQGGRDFQITETDFNIWKNGLKNNKAEFKLYPDLNHFFIKGKGKSKPSEYNKPGNVDEGVINDMASWILLKNK